MGRWIPFQGSAENLAVPGPGVPATKMAGPLYACLKQGPERVRTSQKAASGRPVFNPIPFGTRCRLASGRRSA